LSGAKERQLKDQPFRITGQSIVWDGFCRLTKYDVDLQLSDGRWAHHTREVHDHGSGACCLLLDPKEDTVLLTEQLRLPVALDDPNCGGLSIEIPGGLLDGEDPLTRIQEELLEETGYKAENLTQVYDLFSSPGAIAERLALFLGSYDLTNQVEEGGGLDVEGENITVLHVPFDEALAMSRDGRIRDAKTVLLLLELALRRLED